MGGRRLVTLDDWVEDINLFLSNFPLEERGVKRRVIIMGYEKCGESAREKYVKLHKRLSSEGISNLLPQDEKKYCGQKGHYYLKMDEINFG